MKHDRRLVSLATLVALLSPSALAQAPLEPPSEALFADALTYAEVFDVDLDEAVRRLQLQDEAGRLSAVFADEEAGEFAGLWIEHRPVWRVIALFRNPVAARPRLEKRIAGTPLTGRVELRSAARTLVQLEQLLTVSHGSLRAVALPVDLSIDVPGNRVEVRTKDPQRLAGALFAARLELPRGVAVVAVDDLARPEAIIYGGTNAGACTWGFTVRSLIGTVGILTAAHCPNTQFFADTVLPFRAEDQQGNQDVQWHSTCDLFDVSNQFDSGVGLRSCIGSRGRDQQAIGSMVCKNGKTTGRTCGIIQSKSYRPSWVTSAQATFVYVDGDQVGVNLSEPGDSGAPWFVDGYAYGIHSGGIINGNDSIYMPINYILTMGLGLFTSEVPKDCAVCGDGLCEVGEKCKSDCG